MDCSPVPSGPCIQFIHAAHWLIHGTSCAHVWRGSQQARVGAWRVKHTAKFLLYELERSTANQPFTDLGVSNKVACESVKTKHFFKSAFAEHFNRIKSELLLIQP